VETSSGEILHPSLASYRVGREIERYIRVKGKRKWERNEFKVKYGWRWIPTLDVLLASLLD
jgi:hypothetical protein